MKEMSLKVEKIQLLGGRLCLDFANTVDWHASDQPEELLVSFPALVAWSCRVNLLSKIQASVQIKRAESDPVLAERFLKRMKDLREALYRIFSAVSYGNTPAEPDLVLLNREMAQAATRSRLVFKGSGFYWDWRSGRNDMDWILGPVLYDALQLLTSADLKRVRECGDEKCGWLFMDTSRNSSRRWCSMGDCGNRAKARRHYHRLKKK